ncbi:MAG TPA: HAD-IB family phosphatase [Thermoanaerobaculia bacterium]|nr:HAD-IB family phosphatase [Thermoanaerobaculia bacterium]
MTSKYRFVFFDVDSTLVTIEGIDVLAGGNPEIVRLTELAMNGEISVEEVYQRRLDIIRPSRSDIEALAQRYLGTLVDGTEETIRTLRDGGAVIHLVTAGIRQAIEPLAAHLGIRNVHAVSLTFDEQGSYDGFDSASPLARSGGKELVVRNVLTRSKGKSAFVGDGVTDLEAKPVVDLFVGFGGVHVRPRVRENAEVYVTEPTMTAVLPYLMQS